MSRRGYEVLRERAANVGFRVGGHGGGIRAPVGPARRAALNSDEALASVGVLAMPVLYYGGAVVLAVVGLVLLLRAGRGPSPATSGQPLSEADRTGL